jgi:hypothetical protein
MTVSFCLKTLLVMAGLDPAIHGAAPTIARITSIERAA